MGYYERRFVRPSFHDLVAALDEAHRGVGHQVWQHEVAAIIGAKVVKRAVKLMLTRADMFTSVGYRPLTWQKIGIGATADGKLVGGRAGASIPSFDSLLIIEGPF